MVKPTRFLPPSDDDIEPEVTRETVAAQKRAEAAAARRREAEAKTRRSWYTSTAAADAFSAAVDDIHHATRVPKHLVVAALLEAAVEQAGDVERRLAPVGKVRPVRQVRSHAPSPSKT